MNNSGRYLYGSRILSYNKKPFIKNINTQSQSTQNRIISTILSLGALFLLYIDYNIKTKD